jgi:hypothetical protein
LQAAQIFLYYHSKMSSSPPPIWLGSPGLYPTTSTSATVIEAARSVGSSSSDSDSWRVPPAEWRKSEEVFIKKLEARQEEIRKQNGRWAQNPLNPPVGVTDQEWAKRCLEADKREKQMQDKEANQEKEAKMAAIEGWLAETDTEGSDTETEKGDWEGTPDDFEGEKKGGKSKKGKDKQGKDGKGNDDDGFDDGQHDDKDKGKDGKDNNGKEKGPQGELSVENLKLKETLEAELENLKSL